MSWNRDELFAAAALTLGELLARVPGVTLMAAGFMLAPQVLAWHGDPAGVRLFIDGVERDEITPRNDGITDFSLVPLWAFEQVTLEETAGALRVHARTWRVERTTASTRTDVLTGSENLNLFRGFFGKRSARGVALQLAAQQAGSQSLPGMDGDALGGFARLGWAGGDWSVDATMLRQGLKRTVGARFLRTATPDGKAMPPFNGATSMSYLRVGWRDAQGTGVWGQFIAATLGSKLQPTVASTFGSTTTVAADSADTTSSNGQYTATGGVNRGDLRLSGTLRARTADSLVVSPSVRAEYIRPSYSVSAFAERRFSATAWDLRAAAAPREWLKVSGTTGSSVSRADGAPSLASRVDAAVRLRERWLGIGAVRAADRSVAAPIELDTAMRAVSVPAGTALTFSAFGPVWRGWMARTEVTRWNGATAYRPEIEAHSSLWFASSFGNRFPSANFHLMAGLSHDYRTRFFVPLGSDPVGQATKPFSVFGTQLEVRIGNAVVSWDYRNMAGTYYDTFPGYLMPRITSVYGIRWAFWN